MILEMGLLTDDIQRWKEAYLLEKEALGCAISTIKQYTRVINSLIEYSLQNEEFMKISQLNTEYITNYLLWKANSTPKKKIEASTRTLHLTVLKDFYLYITQNNDEQIDFTKNLKRLKYSKSKKVKEFYKKDEIETILEFLNEKSQKKLSFLKIRSTLILKLFLLGGLRVMEICNLRLDDIKCVNDEKDDSYCEVLINGKGNKQRIVYISFDNIYRELSLYKKFASELGFTGKSSIAITQKERTMKEDEVYKSITNLLDQVPGIKTLNPHALRRSFANLVDRMEGTTLKDVQDLLGHENINTTAIYVNSLESNKKDIAKLI